MALSPKLEWSKANPLWAQSLNPILAFPPNSGVLLTRIALVSGSNAINHKLGQTLKGWAIVRKRLWITSGTVTTYDVTDTQDNNTNPTQTLILYCTQGTASNPVLVDIEVF